MDLTLWFSRLQSSLCSLIIIRVNRQNVALTSSRLSWACILFDSPLGQQCSNHFPWAPCFYGKDSKKTKYLCVARSQMGRQLFTGVFFICGWESNWVKSVPCSFFFSFLFSFFLVVTQCISYANLEMQVFLIVISTPAARAFFSVQQHLSHLYSFPENTIFTLA